MRKAESERSGGLIKDFMGAPSGIRALPYYAVIAVSAYVLDDWLHHSTLAQEIEQVAVNLYTDRLRHGPTPLAPKLTVVSIDDVPRDRGGTDLRVLQTLIVHSMSGRRKPKLIVLDIDLSKRMIGGPDGDRDPSPEESKFLQFIRTSPIPIVVATFKTSLAGKWDISPQHEGFSGAMTMPHAKTYGVQLWTETRTLMGKSQVEDSVVKVVAEQLEKQKEPSRSTYLTQEVEVLATGLREGRVRRAGIVMDFSGLRSLQQQTLERLLQQASSKAPLEPAAEESLSEAVVFFGDTAVESIADRFTAPGSVGEVAGVYMLALGVQSLFASPITFPTELGDWWIKFASTVLLTTVLYFVMFLCRNRFPASKTHHLTEYLAESGVKWFVILLFSFGAFYLSTFSRVIFTGWLPLFVTALVEAVVSLGRAWYQENK